jgi:hypothetical protein
MIQNGLQGAASVNHAVSELHPVLFVVPAAAMLLVWKQRCPAEQQTVVAVLPVVHLVPLVPAALSCAVVVASLAAATSLPPAALQKLLLTAEANSLLPTQDGHQTTVPGQHSTTPCLLHLLLVSLHGL